jgi:hypothetical protein
MIVPSHTEMFRWASAQTMIPGPAKSQRMVLSFVPWD